jgi:Na+/phosphate symporter
MKQETTISHMFQMLASDSAENKPEDDRTSYGVFSTLKQVQAGLLVMNDKLIKIARLLPECIRIPSELLVSDGENLAIEVHHQEKQLTKRLLEADVAPLVRTGLIRLPYRLTRIADMMDSILNCCKIKMQDNVLFTSEAHAEFDRLCATLLHMLLGTKEALSTAKIQTLEHILSNSEKLYQMLMDFRLAHWGRVKAGICHYQASSMYLDILDSMDMARRYLEKISRTISEFKVDPSGAGTVQEQMKVI